MTLPQRLLRSPALLLVILPLLLAGAVFCSAAELPQAPVPQVPAAPSPTPANPAEATVTGIVTDSDGAALAGARITLTRADTPSDPSAPIITSSASDGTFELASVPPGAFNITVSAVGFSSALTSGVLHAGEARQLSAISLHSASTTSIVVVANQEEMAQAQLQQEEKQRVLGFVPNFYVNYDPHPVSLTARQKFSLANHTQIDPFNFAITGVVAGSQLAAHAYNWELGASGFGKRYAAAYGNFLFDNYLTDAVFPALFRQDPRYFYKGNGSIRSRAFYAIANAVVCKGDNQHWQPNYSGILGGLAAGGISYLYYPAADRAGAGLTFESAGIGTGFTAVANLIQEFALRKVTPHTKRKSPPTP